MNPKSPKELLPEQKQALIAKIRHARAYMRAY